VKIERKIRRDDFSFWALQNEITCRQRLHLRMALQTLSRSACASSGARGLRCRRLNKENNEYI
jgi:hypothetical protein